MGVFYPGLAVNLIMRFDEALLTGDSSPAPQSAEQVADATSSLSLPGGGTQKEAGLLAGTKDRLSHVLSIIPKQASVEQAGYRQAGKFSLTFAWRDLPIDPRALRALGVEIFIGTVKSADFARGMRGETDNGHLASFITQDDSNLMMVGVVDNHTVKYTDKGSELTLDGRDLRGIFLDAKVSPLTLSKLTVDQPINKLVEQILGLAAQGQKIQVEKKDEDWPNNTVPNAGPQELLTRSNLGAKGKKPGIPVKGEPGGLSYWDLITNFCSLVGAVPFFRGHTLWLRAARGLYDQIDVQKAGQPGHETPFANGKVRSIPTKSKPVDISFRRMVYGRNISNLTFERKLQGTKVPSVLCVGLDPSKKGKEKILEAQWPDNKDGANSSKVAAAKVTNVDPSGNATSTEVLRIPIPGIKDKDRLRSIAKQIYEEVGRGEMGGSCSSKDLASLGGSNDDADILHLRPGDACEFLVDSTGVDGVPPVVSELNLQAADSIAEASKKLAARLGGRTDLAQLLVGVSRGAFAKLQSIFRVENVKYTWEAASGIGVDFDFKNYIETRYDVIPSASEKQNQEALAKQKAKQKSSNPTGSSPGTKTTTVNVFGKKTTFTGF